MLSESVKYGEKIASVCFKSRDRIHEHHNHAFLLTAVAMPIDSAHSMYNACMQDMCFLFMCTTKYREY